MSITYYGVGGTKYQTIEEAWTDYFNELYGDISQMSSEEYHDKYLIFVSGILSGMNIVSTRFNVLHKDQGLPDGTSIKRAMMTLANEAIQTAAEEYRQAGRGRSKT